MTNHHDQPTQTFASIGIDIGKDVVHIVGFDTSGKVVLRKKFKRLALEAEFAKLPPSIVGVEACLSAYFVSGTLRRRSHRRSGAAAQPARRAGEDAGSARSAGITSGARAARLAPHGDHQPDPRLPHRAWHRRM